MQESIQFVFFNQYLKDKNKLLKGSHVCTHKLYFLQKYINIFT